MIKFVIQDFLFSKNPLENKEVSQQVTPSFIVDNIFGKQFPIWSTQQFKSMKEQINTERTVYTLLTEQNVPCIHCKQNRTYRVNIVNRTERTVYTL